MRRILSATVVLSFFALGGCGKTAAPVTVTISPKTATVNQGASQTFTATITGATNTAVTWTVTESAGGSITSAGVYTAPAISGTYHVVVTSAADTTRSDTATVTVAAALPAVRPFGVNMNQLLLFYLGVTSGGATNARQQLLDAAAIGATYARLT